jgi:hypothetical protein
MLRLLFFISFLFSMLTTAAQTQFGVKGGLNAPDINIEKFTSVDGGLQEVRSAGPQYGFHAGIFAKFKLTNFFLQPEVLYTNLHSEVKAQNSTGGNVSNSSFFQRIDVPILLGTNLGPVRVMAGPIYSVPFSNSGDITQEELFGGTIGYQVGIGAIIGNIHVDFRYEAAFNDAAREVILNNTNYETDWRVNQFIISVGCDLF